MISVFWLASLTFEILLLFGISWCGPLVVCPSHLHTHICITLDILSGKGTAVCHVGLVSCCWVMRRALATCCARAAGICGCCCCIIWPGPAMDCILAAMATVVYGALFCFRGLDRGREDESILSGRVGVCVIVVVGQGSTEL